MNEKLRQAVAAARNGQSTEAQLLLTQALKDNPEDTQAWFLLSNLVDSEQKKIAYLGKVLALDPQHDRARHMLARLRGESAEKAEAATAVPPETVSPLETEPAPAAMPISKASADYLAQEKGDTVPEWLADEEGIQWEEPLPTYPPTDAPDVAETSDVPDWLQDEVDKTWSDESTPAEPVLTTASPVKTGPAQSVPKPGPTSDDDLRKQQAFLTRLLYVLITVAAIISVTLLYLILKTV